MLARLSRELEVALKGGAARAACTVHIAVGRSVGLDSLHLREPYQRAAGRTAASIANVAVSTSQNLLEPRRVTHDLRELVLRKERAQLVQIQFFPHRHAGRERSL